VSPTDNGALNQIPAGDGRESSREQVVPDDGALFFHGPSFTEAGRSISSKGVVQEISGRVTSLTHKKKKKKEKKKSGRKQRWGWCGSGNYTWVMKWRLCECSGMGGGVRWD